MAGEKTVTFRLDEELYQLMKNFCFFTDAAMNGFMNEAIDEKLKRVDAASVVEAYAKTIAVEGRE